MSKIGKLPIIIPNGVVVTQIDNLIVVKGPKAELRQQISPVIKIEIKKNELIVYRLNDEKKSKALHGLYRSLVNNMIVGVSKGYKKELELVGIGYRVMNTGNLLNFALGYTHNIYLQLPIEINVETRNERNKNPLIILESANKQLLGQACAKIRSFRKVDPYKGKGIRFVGEMFRKKSGKSTNK
ncbi:MAG: 50S ribosomal protein L6 [Bacteroidales bacterium OttesenSCG-928-I14]|jgi:large subunit ribosomal protein L6|nr:50S ribosomal protein L6 [Bacteroidales bacterium OttesenSCG-928-I14]